VVVDKAITSLPIFSQHQRDSAETKLLFFLLLNLFISSGRLL
jgi:hypothetical protein